MTRKELILRYQQRILNSRSQKNELELIIQEMNQLVYEKTQQNISNEDKRKILEELRVEIITESLKHFAQDNSDFLKLLDATIKTLGGKK